MRKAILATIVMMLVAPWAGSGNSRCASAPPNATGQPASRLPARAVDVLTLTVPAETEAAVELLSGIHTQVNRAGDPIVAELLQPVYVNGRVALPEGSLLEGRITRVQPARRLRRPGQLALRFETIILPDGQARPIAAGVAALDNPASLKVRVDAEGHLKGTKVFPWRKFTGGLLGLGALATVQTGFVGAAVLGALLPVGSGATLAYAFLWPRGNEVHVPPETRFHIRLDYPLTVTVLR